MTPPDEVSDSADGSKPARNSERWKERLRADFGRSDGGVDGAQEFIVFAIAVAIAALFYLLKWLYFGN